MVLSSADSLVLVLTDSVGRKIAGWCAAAKIHYQASKMFAFAYFTLVSLDSLPEEL